MEKKNRPINPNSPFARLTIGLASPPGATETNHAAGLSADPRYILRELADKQAAAARAEGYNLGAKETADAIMGGLTEIRAKPPTPEMAHIFRCANVDTTTPEHKAHVEYMMAVKELMDSAPLAKFPPEKRAKIALAWNREASGPAEPKETSRMDQENWNPSALEIVNASRKVRGQKPLAKLENDEPDDKPVDADDDDMTIGEDGKLRRIKKAKAADDDDDQGAPKPSAAEALAARDFAFAVFNSAARARGRKILTRKEFDAL
jgi:hypothetical protein